MSISLIPESAPFDTEQRAWLNGFFAGVLGLSDAAGTGGGAAGGLAASSAALLETDPTATAAPATDKVDAEPAEDYDDAEWHDPGLPIDERLALADGKPKAARLMAAMAQLDCGSCGYLCQSYSAAIADGSETNLTLCSPGGKETAKALKKIAKEDDGASATTTAEAAAKAATPASGPLADKPGWSRANPYPARLLATRNLNGEGSAKHTAHVEIELGADGPTYEVGDALGVFPRNCPDLVAAIVDRLGVSGDMLVDSPQGGQAPLKMVLERDVSLATPTEELLDLLVGSTSNDEHELLLRSWLEDEDRLEDRDVLDVLTEVASAVPDPSRLAMALDPLNPRLYSIASSPKAVGDRVHLTVGRVAWDQDGRERKGVASTFLSDRCGEGDAIAVYVQKSHGFTVPADPAAPMIMIGPGTGIAPFRAFLQERDAAGATGDNWLFFGDQKASCDYLYRDEIESWLGSGLLTRCDTAFSRDQAAKVYVQHRMVEHGAELFAWLERGGSVFVCGDASRMAVDVDNALHTIVAEHGGLTAAETKDYIKSLTKAGRYARDVY